MYFVLFVLHDTSKLDELLDAWDAAGVKGITILASTGMQRMRDQRNGLREDMPLIPRLEDFLRQDENTNRTLFTIVPDMNTADRVIQATESVVGGLNEPHSGIIAVLPVEKAVGLERRSGKA